MLSLEFFFTVLLCIQVLHSIEELSTGFHKKFPLFKMSFKTFLGFEILFQAFFFFVLLQESFAVREMLMHIFALLMFANGLWHIVWLGIVKKYVPGVITAPLHLITFLVFYFTVLV